MPRPDTGGADEHVARLRIRIRSDQELELQDRGDVRVAVVEVLDLNVVGPAHRNRDRERPVGKRVGNQDGPGLVLPDGQIRPIPAAAEVPPDAEAEDLILQRVVRVCEPEVVHLLAIVRAIRERPRGRERDRGRGGPVRRGRGVEVVEAGVDRLEGAAEGIRVVTRLGDVERIVRRKQRPCAEDVRRPNDLVGVAVGPDFGCRQRCGPVLEVG